MAKQDIEMLVVGKDKDSFAFTGTTTLKELIEKVEDTLRIREIYAVVPGENGVAAMQKIGELQLTWEPEKSLMQEKTPAPPEVKPLPPKKRGRPRKNPLAK